MGMNIRSPSFNGGMNSVPMPRATTSAPTNSRAAPVSARHPCLQGPFQHRPVETPQLSHHGVRLFGMQRAAQQIRAEHGHQPGSPATTVAARTAIVFVKCQGWNSLPSWPVSANTGINASRTMAIEKNTGPRDHLGRRRAQNARREVRSVVSMAPCSSEAERVLGDDNARIHEDADGDRDPGQGNDVRGHAGVVHPEDAVSTASGRGRVTMMIERRCIRTPRARIDDDDLLDQGPSQRTCRLFDQP